MVLLSTIQEGSTLNPILFKALRISVVSVFPLFFFKYSLISSLSNYVLSSTLSSTLNNYATTSALSSYRLISDSFNKSDVTNEVVIRTGYSGLNSDGSIKTCKQYTDENIAGVSAVTATNSGAIAGLVASLATTNATIAIIEGEIAIIFSTV